MPKKSPKITDTSPLDLLDVPLPSDAEVASPFETRELRKALPKFFNTLVEDSALGSVKLGNYKWGVYAFYDYDDEPIYVGQTRTTLRGRIGRHLTNQRTDAVAMNVLDPFEVCSIAVWPLAQFQNTGSKDKDANYYLDALEHSVYQQLLGESKFHAVLNEKAPPSPRVEIVVPEFHKVKIVTPIVSSLRDHPDLRIARRAMTLSRLAQVISERKVPGGLRLVLLTQAKRLQWLAQRRYNLMAGIVEDAEPLRDED
jgi:hypothetical protein